MRAQAARGAGFNGITWRTADGLTMDGSSTPPTRRVVETPSGRISYIERGKGPVALFIHGVLLNSHLWRHQLAELSDVRRCIALDLLAHGDTEIRPDQDVSVTANARMLGEFLDALKIVAGRSGRQRQRRRHRADLRRAESAARTQPHADRTAMPTTTGRRSRSSHSWTMAAAGGLRGALEAMLADKNVYRSPQALGPGVRESAKASPMPASKRICGRWCGPSNGPATSSASSPLSTTRTR